MLLFMCGGVVLYFINQFGFMFIESGYIGDISCYYTQLVAYYNKLSASLGKALNKAALKMKLFKIGLILGLLPISLLTILFLLWWGIISTFAFNINPEGIGFLLSVATLPCAIIGLILLILFLIQKPKAHIRVFLIGTFLLFLTFPLLLIILKSYGHISPRAYLRIKNKTGSEIKELMIIEPDTLRSLGGINIDKSIISYYYPDYAEYNGQRYPGISENYLNFKCGNKDLKINLPIIHPGEIHELTITENLILEDKHLNKVEIRK